MLVANHLVECSSKRLHFLSLVLEYTRGDEDEWKLSLVDSTAVRVQVEWNPFGNTRTKMQTSERFRTDDQLLIRFNYMLKIGVV